MERAEIEAAVEAEKSKADPSEPTGSCTIRVFGLDPVCTNGMTFESCAAVAASVGGIQEWKEGGRCP